MDKRKKQPKREIEVDFTGVETARGVRVPPGWWLMKNGRFVEIKDMSLSHLQMAMSLLRDKGRTKGKFEELQADLDRREMEIVQGVVNRMRADMLNRTPTPPMVVSTDRQGRLTARNAPDFRVATHPIQNRIFSFNPDVNELPLGIKPEPPSKPSKKRKITREKK